MISLIKSNDYAAFRRRLESSSELSDRELVELLVEAVNEGNEPFVTLLLRHGANPNAQKEGALWNTTHLVIEHGHLSVLGALIDFGADIESRDNAGFTPLHHAVESEADGAYQMGEPAEPSLSKLLLNANADPKAVDHSGKSVIRLAEEYEYVEFLRLVEATPT